MIPKDYITEWRARAPWAREAQIEQDLVLSRALVELFGEARISNELGFRGATAIYKLHQDSIARYSEDIDLVQVSPSPIGPALDAIRARLDPWLGTPRRTLKEGRIALVYRFASEDSPPLPLRLKIEINSREHFTHLGHVRIPFRMDNRWYAGAAEVTSFTLDELAGTKLRALYQRKKGRDLFDLWYALDRGLLDPAVVVECFRRYMDRDGTPVTRAQFEANLAAKAKDPTFRADVRPLLAPGVRYDDGTALERVQRDLVACLPGEPWKGRAALDVEP